MLANQFEIQQHLGSGATAEVFKVKDKESGAIFAAKIIKLAEG